MDAVGARTLLGRVQLETGDAEGAERYAREAIDLADQRGLGATPTFAYGQAILGLILVRRGDPAAAAAELEQALPAIRALGEPLSIAEALLALGEARRAVGRREEAVALQREAGTIIDSLHDPGNALVALRRAPPRGGRGRRPSDQVSKRELEVLRAMANGASKREAAEQLFVSYNTVHSHVRSLYQKLDAHSLGEAIARARELGLMDNSTEEARKSPG
jgi:LuxR family maltose regulon positive regulatory protein